MTEFAIINAIWKANHKNNARFLTKFVLLTYYTCLEVLAQAEFSQQKGS